MGAIQNEVNQLLGTAAVVAGGYKKLKLDKLHATQEAIEKDPSLAKEYEQNEEMIKEHEKDIETLKKGGIPLSASEHIGLYSSAEDYNREIKKRELAIAELQGRRKAISMQRKEYAKLIGGKK